MKKLSLLLASAVVGSAAMAQTVIPRFFYEDFGVMANENDAPTSDWATYGNGATPGVEGGADDAELTEYLQAYFPSLTNPPYFCLLQYDKGYGAFSGTNFIPTTKADQWLVTPEIEVPTEEAILTFRTLAYSYNGLFGRGNCPIAVYVSESGAAKEDFNTTPIFSTSISTISSTQSIPTKDFIVPLNGYKGKKIHLAFVQTGESVGMVGFTNINVGQYYCDLDATNTPEVANPGEYITINVNAGMKTSVTCAGVDTKLVVNGETVATKYFPKNLFAGSQIQYVNIKFNNIVDQIAASSNWTLYVTPDFDGAETSSISGLIGAPVTTYLNNCVVEELTASGCQYCPAGTASMEYYEKTYQGSESLGRGKFIGIAVHGNMNYLDPMSEGVENYKANVSTKIGSTSIPMADFNRNTYGQYPWQSDNVLSQVTLGSTAKVEISEVKMPLVDKPEDIFGKTGTVEFDVYSSYNAHSRNLNAAVVMVENDVQGYNQNYNQLNAFYNMSESTITSNYGSFLLPYMRKFLPKGDLGMYNIPFDKITYQHVARGIWPEYQGESLGEMEWVADQPNHFSISFTIPDNILKMDNTEMIVLITDPNRNGKIIASNIFKASDYAYSGVNSISTETSFIVEKVGNVLNVKGEEGQTVNIYGVDGTVLGQYTLGAESLAIDGSSFAGLVIVKSGAAVKKVLF